MRRRLRSRPCSGRTSSAKCDDQAQYPETLALLFAAVVITLLIASANIVNMILTQTIQRQGEMRTRAALGATPDRGWAYSVLWLFRLEHERGTFTRAELRREVERVEREETDRTPGSKTETTRRD